MALAVSASFLWALTPIFEKIAIRHTEPESSSIVALATTALTVVGLTWSVQSSRERPWPAIAREPKAFAAAATIAGFAPLFGFAAIAGGLVGYVTGIFKLSTLLTVIWASILLKEPGLGRRLPAAAVMIAGTSLLAL